jgi:hypothetical protein
MYWKYIRPFNEIIEIIYHFGSRHYFHYVMGKLITILFGPCIVRFVSNTVMYIFLTQLVLLSLQASGHHSNGEGHHSKGEGHHSKGEGHHSNGEGHHSKGEGHTGKSGHSKKMERKVAAGVKTGPGKSNLSGSKWK